MSDSDSFINEVSEEVRRDRLYAGMRRYGWIAVLLVLVIVAGAGWNEYRKAQARDTAQTFGSAILAGLAPSDASARIDALSEIDAPGPDAAAVLTLLNAAEAALATGDAAAAERLSEVAGRADLSPIYRQIASFSALTRATGTMSAEERRIGFEALTNGPLRLLAQEQLALIDIETGDTDAAIARLEAMLADAAVTQGLRRRASQLIVALGGTPERA